MLVTLGALTLCAILFIFNDCSVFWEHRSHSIENTIASLENALTPALEHSNQAEVQSVLNSLKIKTDILDAEVRDQRGALIAQFQGQQKMGKLVDKIGFQTISKNITTNRGERANLIVRWSISHFLIQLVSSFLILTGALILGMMLSFILGQNACIRIVAPLKAVIDNVKAHSIRSERQYTGESTDIQSSNSHDLPPIFELEELREHLEHLVSNIQKRDEALLYANDSLENIVEKRTRELKETQSALLLSARMSALGEMAGGIAHEINNPLGIISGQASILKDMCESNEFNRELFLRGLEKVEKTSQRIAKIVKGLKSFSRDGSDDAPEKVQVQTIISDVLELCSSKMQSRGIALQVSGQVQSLTIECRPTELGQVLLNLLNNASDAIEALEERWITLEVQSEGDSVIFVITDSGKGIPQDVREKMMQPFFTTKDVGKGTGLGLSISKGIVEKHLGTLRYDEGCTNTRFVVSLPRTAKKATQSPAAA